MKLYELSTSYTLLRDLMDDPDTEPGAWEQALADLEDQATTKVASLGLLIREVQAETGAIEDEITRLQARLAGRREAMAGLQSYLITHMPLMGLERVKDARITVWLQDSPPAVTISDPGVVPPEFVRWTLTLPLEEVPTELRERDNEGGITPKISYDRRAILDVIKGGLEVPGATVSQQQHVRIH